MLPTLPGYNAKMMYFGGGIMELRNVKKAVCQYIHGVAHQLVWLHTHSVTLQFS